jgi:hypothetical protein
MDQQQRDQPFAWALMVFLKVTSAVSHLTHGIRRWRGPRCDSVMDWCLGLLAPPFVWAMCGGGSPRTMQTVWYGLIGLSVLCRCGWANAKRKGIQVHSRYIGTPIPWVVFPWLPEGAAHCLEAALWCGAGAVFAVYDGPGTCAIFVASGLCGLVEVAVLSKRDNTLLQDAEDARLRQTDFAQHLRRD